MFYLNVNVKMYCNLTVNEHERKRQTGDGQIWNLFAKVLIISRKTYGKSNKNLASAMSTTDVIFF